MRGYSLVSCAVFVIFVTTAAARGAEPEAGDDPLVWGKAQAPPAMREMIKGSEYEYELASAAAQLLKLEGPPATRARSTMQMAQVTAGSNAERSGLRTGDSVVTLNGKTIWQERQALPWNKTGDQLLEIERGGRRLVIKLKDAGDFEGVRLVRNWVPVQWYQLGGQRDPRWESEVRVGSAFFRGNPRLAETAWHHAIRKGYKPDVLTWWCGLEVSRLQNRTRQAIEFGSFLPEDSTGDANPVPFQYDPITRLQMTFAAGRLDLFADALQKAAKEDAHRATATRASDLFRIHQERPAEVRASPMPAVLAKSMNRVDVLGSVVNTGEPLFVHTLRCVQTIRPFTLTPATDHFSMTRSGLDRPTRNLELVVKFSVRVTDDKQGTNAKELRIGLIERGGEGNAPLAYTLESRQGKSMVRIGFGDDNITPDFIYSDPSLLMNGTAVYEVRLTRVGGWAQVFMYDVCIGAVPVEDGIENMDFLIHAVGVTAVLHDVRMYELVDPRIAFDSLFGAKIKAARATAYGDDDVALARVLLDQARTGSHQPATLTLFCETAHDLAAPHAEGYAVAAQAMKLLAAALEDRRDGAREKLIAALTSQAASGPPAERPAAAEAVIDALIARGDEKLDFKEHTAAAEDYQRAMAVATRIESPALEELKSKIDLALARGRAAKALALAEQKVLKDSRDSAAAEQIIRIHLTDFDNPAAAACYASFAKDEQFRTLTPLTAGSIEQAKDDDALRLGEWYLKLARGTPETATPAAALDRSAAYLYWHLASHAQEDAQRTRAKAVLAQVTEARTKLSAARAKPDPDIVRLLSDAVLIYTFDQPTIARTPGSITIADLSGKGNDAVGEKVFFSPGVAGQCLFLDNNDAIKSKLPVGIAGSGARTLSLWHKMPRSRVRGNIGAFVHWGDEALGKAFGIGPWNGGYMLWGYGEHHDWHNITPASADWQHHIITYDGTTVRWYLNGQPLDKTRNHPYATSDTALIMGRTPAGWVDELAIFSRALTKEEAAQLFRASRAGLAKSLGK